MPPTRRYAKKQANALKQRRLNAKERHHHQQRRAQRDIDALRQALDDLGLPADLVIEIERGWAKSLASCFPPSLGAEVPNAP
jgi:hypothetical protein